MSCASPGELTVDQDASMNIRLVRDLGLVHFTLMNLGVGDLAGLDRGTGDEGARNVRSLDGASLDLGTGGVRRRINIRVDDCAGRHLGCGIK